MSLSRATRRRTSAAFVAGLGWAVLIALPSGSAVAQSWTQVAPSASPVDTIAPSRAPPLRPTAARNPEVLDFERHPASPEVEHVARWVRDSGDNGRMPYMIVDKVNAKVFVFNAGGRLQGAEPALLGMVQGDRSAKGVGDQKLSAIRLEDRITPAGRFVASLALDLQGQDILWIDYASALALHRVVKGKPVERRAERLQSETSEDNRISYGCINVPVKFFENVVSPAFSRTSGIVYILPETGTAREMFGSYDVGSDTQAKAATQR